MCYSSERLMLSEHTKDQARREIFQPAIWCNYSRIHWPTKGQWSQFIYLNGTQFALLPWTENWKQLLDFCWPSCI